MVAMVSSHFLHAPFVPVTPGAPGAKVVYARDGSWLYVIVAPGSEPLDVIAISGNKRSSVATIPAGSAMRSAYVTPPNKVDTLELDEGGRVLSQARIAYVAPKER